jgi:hypothetical protein
MNQGMPPWEAFRWFDSPVETVVDLGIDGLWHLVAAQNVRRVALWLGSAGTANLNFSPSPRAGLHGFYVTGGALPLVLRQQADGVLCQVEWYAQGSPGGTVNVVEVLLRAWPGEPGIG